MFAGVDTKNAILAVSEQVQDLLNRTGSVDSDGLLEYKWLCAPEAADITLYARFLERFRNTGETDEEAFVNYLAALEDRREELQARLEMQRAEDQAAEEAFDEAPDPAEEALVETAAT